MNCRLCLQPKPLRASHIIPEFMHQDMYDPKHRFFGLSGQPEKKDKIFQKGMRESLLCDDCEQQFGRYEKYASQVFYGGSSLGMRREQNVILLTGLHYAPLKLFFLSLLWRMGITSIPYLKGLDLGAHEPRLRELLRAEQPANFLTYPCLLTAVMHQGKHVPDLIVPPGVAKVDQHEVWSFVAAGFVFSFFLSDDLPPAAVHDAFLRPPGTLWIRVAEISEIDFLHQHATEIGEAQRQRRARRKPGSK